MIQHELPLISTNPSINSPFSEGEIRYGKAFAIKKSKRAVCSHAILRVVLDSFNAYELKQSDCDLFCGFYFIIVNVH